MLSSQILGGVKKHFGSVICSRNLGLAAPVFQKAVDPIQKLFVDKIREYKGKSTGGKLVDPTPDLQKELKAELDKVTLHYGGNSGEDMTKFPAFKFTDPSIDPINLQAEQKK